MHRWIDKRKEERERMKAREEENYEGEGKKGEKKGDVDPIEA